MSTSVNPVGSSSVGQQPTINNSTDALASEQTFMKLLVAQIQYQDPLSPADGVQFMTQLAQFSQLEQMLQMNGHLASIDNGITSAQSANGTTSTVPPDPNSTSSGSGSSDSQ